MTTTADATVDGLEPIERIGRYLSERGLDARAHKIIPLTGDASDRRYFRVVRPDGPPLVLAVYPGPFAFAALPYANVAALLSRIPLPIPAVLDHSDSLGILVQEDLGDVTLQAHLGAATAVEHAAAYRQAVEFIEALQRRGAEIDPAGYVPYQVAFDVEKLTWELDFFVKHFVEGYRGAALAAAERSALGEEWALIAGDLASEPRVLCHRDYHSRNLMVHEDGLSIIDFQDARMGPDTYDLASLLRDSYVDLAERDVDAGISSFLALKDRHGTSQPDEWHGEDRFRMRFDLMAVQRNLKALGTFGYQTTARKNPVYIQYMPRTLRYVRLNLEKYSRFARLRELLAPHLEELAKR